MFCFWERWEGDDLLISSAVCALCYIAGLSGIALGIGFLFGWIR